MASPEFLTQKGLPNPPRRKIRGAGVQESDNSTSCHIDLEKEEESGGGEGSSELEAGRERGREGKKKDADGGKHSGGGGGGEFPKTEEKVAELQARVALLEAELATQRAALTKALAMQVKADADAAAASPRPSAEDEIAASKINDKTSGDEVSGDEGKDQTTLATAACVWHKGPFPRIFRCSVREDQAEAWLKDNTLKQGRTFHFTANLLRDVISFMDHHSTMTITAFDVLSALQRTCSDLPVECSQLFDVGYGSPQTPIEFASSSSDELHNDPLVDHDKPAPTDLEIACGLDKFKKGITAECIEEYLAEKIGWTQVEDLKETGEFALLATQKLEEIHGKIDLIPRTFFNPEFSVGRKHFAGFVRHILQDFMNDVFVSRSAMVLLQLVAEAVAMPATESVMFTRAKGLGDGCLAWTLKGMNGVGVRGPLFNMDGGEESSEDDDLDDEDYVQPTPKRARVETASDGEYEDDFSDCRHLCDEDDDSDDED